MITAAFLSKQKNPDTGVLSKIAKYCPQIHIKNRVDNLDKVINLIQKDSPQVIFLDLADSLSKGLQLLKSNHQFDFELIVFSENKNQFLECLKHYAIGFILKPICVEELILTVHHVEKRLQKQSSKAKVEKGSSFNKVIGIPTMEGYEFVPIQEILRCEGFQKCTRVIIKNRKDIVSSYNLGEFAKLLTPFGFISPHKSFIINPCEILRYYKEGRVQMTDMSCIPVSRRKKGDFLNLLLHV